VIFARRENARRVEDGPASSRRRDHRLALEREPAARGSGGAGPGGAPRPGAFQPRGSGEQPPAEVGGSPITPRWHNTVPPLPFTLPPVVARPVRDPRPRAGRPGAPVGRALEDVQIFLTGSQGALGAIRATRCQLGATHSGNEGTRRDLLPCPRLMLDMAASLGPPGRANSNSQVRPSVGSRGCGNEFLG
jgi:hypothetical protein